MKNLRGSIEGVVENYQPEAYKPVKLGKRPVNPITGFARPKIKTASVYESDIRPVMQMCTAFKSTHN